jgi:hypothetical protein
MPEMMTADPLAEFADPLTAPLASEPTTPTFPWDDPNTVLEVQQALGSELDSADAAFKPHLDKVKRWRGIYDMQPNDREPTYKDGANIQPPLSREKVDAEVAKQADALYQEPAWVFRARTKAGEELRTSHEEFLDMHADRLNAREHFLHATLEAFITGLGISKATYEKRRNSYGVETMGPRLDIVRIEDFRVSPVTVPDLDRAYLVAHRFYEPYWRLEQWFADGVIQQDPTGLENYDTATQNESDNTKHEHAGGHTSTNDGSVVVELWECWWRWQGRMWRIWFHRQTKRILLAEVNPYKHERAPFSLWRWWSFPNYLFGASGIELLEAVQSEYAALLNGRLDANAFAQNPILMAVTGSAAAKYLARHGVEPGLILEVTSTANPEVGQLVLQGANPATLQDMQLLRQSAENILTPGVTAGAVLVDKDRTATEVRRDQQFADTKGKAYLHFLHSGARNLGLLVWHLLYQYEVKPAKAQLELPGVPVPIEVPGIKQFFSKGGQQSIKADDMFMEDLDLEVNGQETQSTRAERSLIWQLLGPQTIQLELTGALQNPRVHSVMRAQYENLGVKDWTTYIGPPPTEEAWQMLQAMRAQAQAQPVQA